MLNKSGDLLKSDGYCYLALTANIRSATKRFMKGRTYNGCVCAVW